MKKSFLSATAIATVMSASAFAADLPSIKSAPSNPIPMWTGFYAGLNAGYGFGTNNNTVSSLWNSGSWDKFSGLSFVVGVPPANYTKESGGSYVGSVVGIGQNAIRQSGFVGGGQVGYNMLVMKNILLGLEADIQGSTVQGNDTGYGYFSNRSADTFGGTNNVGYPSGLVSLNVSSNIDYIGTARGRVGYLVMPNLLIYGTGGLAYGQARANISLNAGSTTSFTPRTQNYELPPTSQYFYSQTSSSSLLVGYSAGGGVEWMFMPNWSLKTEAIYYNLGNMNISTYAIGAATSGAMRIEVPLYEFMNVGNGVISGNTSVNYQGIIARAGINYHFDFGKEPTVIAKY